MTDNRIEKIRAEIERRMKGHCPIVCSYIIYEDILNFIDSMQEEPTIPDIVDEHYWEMLGEEPVSEDLDSFAIKYAQDKPYPVTVCQAVKVGANWQKEQDKQWLAEEHKNIFAKGGDSMKQQMMKNAKDGVITFDYYGDNDKIYGCIAHDSFSLKELGLKDGDKVKLIIIKEG